MKKGAVRNGCSLGVNLYRGESKAAKYRRTPKPDGISWPSYDAIAPGPSSEALIKDAIAVIIHRFSPLRLLGHRQ
ncbi:MAG: hypothetical protein M2R45_04280 [Verrucomicrobia subdivision 3 bacterium]|nr:hypothetical protein [Limisphaerales bacterium]MCS1417387.1 hypothetical protein [Limisphaerales bacterium]